MTTLRLCHNQTEWDDYVLENSGHPLQLWGWGELKTAHGWEADRLLLRDDEDQVIGAVQVLIRKLPWPLKSFAYVPRGPIVDPNNRSEMLELLADYVRRAHSSVTVAVEPDSIDFSVPKGWKKSRNHILPARTISIDLNKPEPEILSDMDNQTRRYIRKSTAEGTRVKMVHSKEDLDACLAIYQETSKRAKFDLHSNQYYTDVFYKMGDYSPIFAAYAGDQIVAFLWLAISADVAFEFYAGINEEGRKLNANHILKWHAIRKCKEWGLSRYDFGGLVKGGVETFKLGWAKDVTELAGTFEKPLSKTHFIWSHGLPTAKKVARRIKKIIRH
ncbi:peptidoglycan bridge formation glycyltransferase FemA/FemB family protein [Candidatus Saccharibacteria bacterium]|nr:peptidoglycan bridge formation glycyltransferase FemA/FemB family protein [Candidatus Saccharibacteria bacterium]